MASSACSRIWVTYMNTGIFASSICSFSRISLRRLAAHVAPGALLATKSGE